MKLKEKVINNYDLVDILGQMFTELMARVSHGDKQHKLEDIEFTLNAYLKDMEKVAEDKKVETMYDTHLEDGSIILATDRMVMTEKEYYSKIEQFKENLKEETFGELSGCDYIEISKKEIKDFFNEFMETLESDNLNK